MRGGYRDNCNMFDVPSHCCCKDYGNCFNDDSAWHKMLQPGCPDCRYSCECDEYGEDVNFKCLCYPCNKTQYLINIFRLCIFCEQDGINRKII